MPTIIDSLVVELGLDTNNFSPKAKSAVDDLNKLNALEQENEKRFEGCCIRQYQARVGSYPWFDQHRARLLRRTDRRVRLERLCRQHASGWIECRSTIARDRCLRE